MFYASNYFGLARAFSPSYKVLEGKKVGGFGGFIHDILVGDGLFEDEHSRRQEISIINQSGIKIYVDLTVTDTFFCICMPFTSVQDINRQQKFVMCLAEGRKKETSVYCGFCTIILHIETDRHPSRHAYCMGGKYK